MQKPPKSAVFGINQPCKKVVSDISRTWNFHQLLLTFQIIISEVLGKILRQKIYQKINGMVKNTVFQNLDLKKIGSRYFLDLKKKLMVPYIIFYHFWEFEKNLISGTYFKKFKSAEKRFPNYWMIRIFFG